MRKLSVFNFVTLNGFYKDANGQIAWHKHDADQEGFSAESVGAGNMLLFGRTTYEMMASFWPTPQAIQSMPLVAAGMNKAEKIVFSNTLKEASWNNTRIIGGNIIEAITELKQTQGRDMTILGSGSIVTQFAEHGLIDEYQIMVDPIAIGGGTTLFSGLNRQLELQLTATRKFENGAMLLVYVPSDLDT